MRKYFKMTAKGTVVIPKAYEFEACGYPLVAHKGKGSWPWTATEPTTGLAIPRVICKTKKGVIKEATEALTKAGDRFHDNIEFFYSENKLTIDLFNAVHNPEEVKSCGQLK